MKVGNNSNLVPAGSRATGVNMKDTWNDEKMDISKEEHAEISVEAEEKTDTAQEDDGVGANCKEGKAMGISDEHFNILASILKMDMPKLKEWFVKSKYEAKKFRQFFNELNLLRNNFGKRRDKFKMTDFVDLPIMRFTEATDISDADFGLLASISKMGAAELKERFEKSKYNAEELRGLFERYCLHPLHIAARDGEVEMVEMLIEEAKVDVNMQVGAGFWRGWTALHLRLQSSLYKCYPYKRYNFIYVKKILLSYKNTIGKSKLVSVKC